MSAATDARVRLGVRTKRDDPCPPRQRRTAELEHEHRLHKLAEGEPVGPLRDYLHTWSHDGRELRSQAYADPVPHEST